MPAMIAPVRRSRRCIPLLALAAAACGGSTSRPTSAPAPARLTNGTGLIAAMHARHAGTWYRSATFVQRTTQVPLQGGLERRSTWYETMQIPGRLRIDTDLQAGAGTLFANDSQYVVVNNASRRAVAGHNVLLVLGFDVYGQDPARTTEVLGSLGFPMTPLREGTWQGRPVWIVGGKDATDLHSPQFWVEKERLLFVRLLQPFPGDTTKTYDVRFSDYTPTKPGTASQAWIAITVEALVGDKRILLEQYDDVKTDLPIDPALFDPKRWGTAKHWAKK